MSRVPWSTAAFLAVPIVAAACSPPRSTEDRATGAPSTTIGTASAGFEGSPEDALLARGTETDVAGELSIRVPSGWIAKQALAKGHAHFMSRDGRVVVTVTDTGATAPDDATVLHWLTRPWMKLGDVKLGTARPSQLGRSGLVAEEGEGSAKLAGESARMRYAKIDRITSAGRAHVLVLLVTAETSMAEDRARGHAAVQSLGPR